MAKITPPKYVKQVLLGLQAREYRAYLVGGCVRDMILGYSPNDWDICTSALPEEVMEVFPASRPTGLKHGTVTVVIGSHSVEVTTFRSDGEYSDHRRPDSISFVTDLTADLSRRDFTMNAVALSPDGLTVDPFGGLEDIRAGIVRCVGEPEQRFGEDALRMFRALRFAARLGFTIDIDTYSAIQAKSGLAAALAAERVRDELEKTLMTNHTERIGEMINLGLLDRYVHRGEGETPSFSALSQLQKKALPRWAVFAIMLEVNGYIGSVRDFLAGLRLDGHTIRCCADASAIAAAPPPQDKLGWKKLLNRYGVDAAACAAAAYGALSGSDEFEKQFVSVLKSGECFSMRRLAVTGDDLLELGLRGPQLGEMMRFLLDYVMEHPEFNRRELLLTLAGGTEES